MAETGQKILVSVVIPCYNQGRFLDEAIKSVLASDYPNVEIIVVNDGSTDPETNRVIANIAYPKTRVIQQTNRGAATARNAGVAAAAGKYILNLDADDSIAPTYISKAVAVLEANPRLGYAYCDLHMFGDENLDRRLPPYDYYRLLWDNQQNGCVVLRKEAWQAVGGFNETIARGYEDWEMWINLGEHGWHGYRIPELLFNYRRHGGVKTYANVKSHHSKSAEIRALHPEIYDNPARLRKIRREWRDTPPLYPVWLALKDFTRGAFFPDRLRVWLRGIVYGRKK